MKIFIMTDMEGVSGVRNFDDWVYPSSMYYEQGKKLLTLEVNAAVEGFFEAGADEIHVADGHGHGGINQELLDNRTYLISGFPGPWPFLLDKSFDAIAWVGQHAKAGTPYSHRTHTQNSRYLDCTINGISMGEFGQLAACASFLGVTPIFASGEKALTVEAKNLLNGIETVSVKEGTTPGTGDELSEEEYDRRNTSAIHMHPDRARRLIKEGAKRAMARYIENRESYNLLDLKPPYSCVVKYRKSGDSSAFTAFSEDPDDIIKMMNGKYVVSQL